MTTDNPWFIAREGQQHGPLNEKEMQLFVERGHLRATDLVWQQGFPDWRPALSVFPPKTTAQHGATAPSASMAPSQPGPALGTAPSSPAQAQPTAQHPSAQQPTVASANLSEPALSDSPASTTDTNDVGGQAADAFGTTAYTEPRRGGGRLLATVAALGILAGGGYAYWTGATGLPSFLQTGNTSTKPVPVVKAPSGADGAQTAALPKPQPAAQSPRRARIDTTLQKGELWQYLKGQYPRWYDNVLDNAERLEDGDDFDQKLAQVLVGRLIELRRQNAEKVLAASQKDLTSLASSFLDNLKFLANRGAEPCYTFISKGEASPAVVESMRNPAAKDPIHSQLLATFKASVAGTKSPVSRDAPQKADYQALTAELAKIGWNKEDIQLFANPKALSEAPPARVCQMVQDWFSAHLSLENAETQERLLHETLRPVVSG